MYDQQHFKTTEQQQSEAGSSVLAWRVARHSGNGWRSSQLQDCLQYQFYLPRKSMCCGHLVVGWRSASFPSTQSVWWLQTKNSLRKKSIEVTMPSGLTGKSAFRKVVLLACALGKCNPSLVAVNDKPTSLSPVSPKPNTRLHDCELPRSPDKVVQLISVLKQDYVFLAAVEARVLEGPVFAPHFSVS